MEIVDNDFKNGFICAFQFALKYGFLLSTCIVRGNMQELYTLSTWFALIKETFGWIWNGIFEGILERDANTVWERPSGSFMNRNMWEVE